MPTVCRMFSGSIRLPSASEVSGSATGGEKPLTTTGTATATSIAASGSASRSAFSAPRRSTARTASASSIGAEPGEAADAELGGESAAGERQRDRVPRAGVIAQEGRGERRRERHENRRADLLDAAPERVAEEQGGLGGDEDGEGTRPGAREKATDQLPEREREHRREEGGIGLEEPGDLTADDLCPRPERQEGPDRVAAPSRTSASPRSWMARGSRGRGRAP